MPSIMSSGSAAGAHDPKAPSSTAPVLEYTCLFTHDLVRKQKRWQDGRIKYHTFNRRVMVYDERGNSMGDMHWCRDWDFGEGEEVKLERGGTIVQVVDYVGNRDQDLSELLDKRVKEKEQRQAKAALRPQSAHRPIHYPSPNRGLQAPIDHFQSLHRPMNQVLGTPTGHYGRAVVPTESPFEQRQRSSETPGDQTGSRPVKRPRHIESPPSKMGYAQNLFGASLTLSATPLSLAPPRRLALPRVRPAHINSSPQGKESRDVEPVVEGGSASQPGSSSTHNASVSSRSRSGPRKPSQPAGYAQNLFGTPLSLSGAPLAPIRRPPAPQNRAAHPASARPPQHSGIDTQVGAARDTEDVDECIMEPKSRVDYFASDCFHTPRPSKEGVMKPNSPEVHGRHFTGLQLGIPHENAATAAKSRTKAPATTNKPGIVEVVLLEETEETPELSKAVPVRKRTKKTDIAPKRPALDGQKQQSAKRKKAVAQPKSLSPARGASPDDVFAQTTEARVEAETSREEKRSKLRLKSRQKRGLLIVSEVPAQVKRPKKSKAEKSAVDLSGGVSSRLADKSVVPPKEPQQPSKNGNPFLDDPFSSSPVTQEILAKQLDTLPSPSRQQRVKDVGMSNKNNDRAFSARGAQGPKTNELKRGEAVYNVPEHSEDEYIDNTPPLSNLNWPKPNGYSVIERPMQDKASVKELPKRRMGTRDAEDEFLDKDDSPVREVPEVAESRPTRQTRKSKRLEDESLRGPRKRGRTAESQESSDEELPQVPVGPRLATLGRRGIRSKEVIGYIMSSSPVAVTRRPPSLDPEPLSKARPSLALTDLVAVLDSTVDDPTLVEEFPGPREADLQARDKMCSRASTTCEPDNIPSLQRQNTLPEPKQHKPTVGGTPQASGADSRMPQAIGESPERQGLVRHKSAVFGTGDGRIGEALAPTTTIISRPFALNDEADSTDTGRRVVSNQEGPHAGQHVAQLALHKAPNPPEDRPHSNPTHSVGKSPPPDGPTTKPAPAMPPVVAPSIPPPPKIINPATRGRKAALKSHAAGQVPQSILPPVESLPARAIIVRPPPETVRQESTGDGRPKRKITFPGFISANVGGPWSREAHDLLESGRPGS